MSVISWCWRSKLGDSLQILVTANKAVTSVTNISNLSPTSSYVANETFKTSEKVIKRHIASMRHRKATENYSVEVFGKMKITAPDLNIKTERTATSSRNELYEATL